MDRGALAVDVRRLEFRTRKRVEDLFVGHYLSAFKGRGIEFAEVREYQPGDDTRTIDWNVTARTGRPHVKRFIEERELTVMVAADISASGDFGSQSRTKRELIVEVSAALTMTAALNRDRAGLMLFTDTVEKIIRPGKGSRHTQRIMRDLLSVRPTGRGTSIATALDTLGRVLRRRALVFLITDFMDSGFERSLRTLARRHEVVALHMLDPREREAVPAGLVTLEDPETGRTWLVDLSSGASREAYRRGGGEEDAFVRRACAKARVDRIVLPTGRPFMPEIVQYFTARGGRRA